MITITNTTQRIFFEPSQSIPVNVELCDVWLLKYGIWSDCGVWDNDAEFIAEGSIPLPRYELVTGAGTIKKTAPLLAQKNSRLYSANADDISQNVGDDDYVFNIYFPELIYSTRLKIKKSQVARKAKAQPVTRKVNRITI